jgi:hypothetical protein
MARHPLAYGLNTAYIKRLSRGFPFLSLCWVTSLEQALL